MLICIAFCVTIGLHKTNISNATKTMKPISVNDKVLCRFYNSIEGKFYGATFETVILETRVKEGEKQFLIQHSEISQVWLHRKEILRRVK